MEDSGDPHMWATYYCWNQILHSKNFFGLYTFFMLEIWGKSTNLTWSHRNKSIYPHLIYGLFICFLQPASSYLCLRNCKTSKFTPGIEATNGYKTSCISCTMKSHFRCGYSLVSDTWPCLPVPEKGCTPPGRGSGGQGEVRAGSLCHLRPRRQWEWTV